VNYRVTTNTVRIGDNRDTPSLARRFPSHTPQSTPLQRAVTLVEHVRHSDNAAARTKQTIRRGGPVSSDATVTRYSASLSPALKAICRALQAQMDASLPKATSKIWHAMPVWFVDESPVVGFKASAKHVTLLFWNGQAFEDSLLIPAGKYKAAQIKFQDAAEIDAKKLRQWLKKAGTLIWDVKSARREAH
jgi:uncharacterized protein YdhG (YjbR/CyaY superfamily)